MLCYPNISRGASVSLWGGHSPGRLLHRVLGAKKEEKEKKTKEKGKKEYPKYPKHINILLQAVFSWAVVHRVLGAKKEEKEMKKF